MIQDIDRLLIERGVRCDEPVAFECTNTVPGALTLLALLGRGSTVVLLPPPGAAPQPLPHFVQHLLRILPVTAQSLHPESFLSAQTVDGCRPLPADSPRRSGHLMLRTSGSLDSPKLVVHSHAGLLANAQNAVSRLGLSASDRILIPVPLPHMYGLGAAFLPALSVGADIELLEGANLLRYLERERSFRPTVAFLTPSLCATLLRPRQAPGHYRHVVVAGDKLSPEAFTQAETIYRRVINLYGSTELGVVSAAAAEETEGPRAFTAGRPLPGVELRISSRDEDAAIDAGSGDLFCAHPYGFSGYVDLDGAPLPIEETAPAGWYATRDVARFHEGGFVEILGRSDHATKRDGRLVMLAEVERALTRLPDVERAAVVLAGQTIRGRALVAFVTSRQGSTVDPIRLRSACQQILPAYAVPDEIRCLSELPLLPSGKLDRRTLATSLST